MKVTNSAAVAVIYDDDITNAKRTIASGETTWVQPSANVPAGFLTTVDQFDGYGKLTRRTFVTAADITTNPAKYNGSSLGQVKYIDEFTGVGESQSLANLLFKRSTFTYSDQTNPTKWTTITETEQREPAGP